MKNSNDVFAGVLIGFILTMGLMWLFSDNKPPTWWCTYLKGEEANYCSDLYDKAIRNIDNMPTEEAPPMPL